MNLLCKDLSILRKLMTDSVLIPVQEIFNEEAYMQTHAFIVSKCLLLQHSEITSYISDKCLNRTKAQIAFVLALKKRHKILCRAGYHEKEQIHSPPTLQQ